MRGRAQLANKRAVQYYICSQYGFVCLHPYSYLHLIVQVPESCVMQVARRVKAHEQVSEGEHSRVKKRAVRYQICSRDGFVYLHPRSNLHSTAPEFVVYTQLISTAKRPYMAGKLLYPLHSFTSFAHFLAGFLHPARFIKRQSIAPIAPLM